MSIDPTARPGGPASPVPARTATVRDVTDLVAALAARGGSPALTWYDADGRVELSGAVLANWVVKTTNLLVEELDAGPGTRVRLDLPAHWRGLLWALGTWRVGATAVLSGPVHDASDVVVTTRPSEATGTGADVVAVTLPALARHFDGVLPPGAIDAAAAVMTYSDALGYVPPTDRTAVALTLAGADVLHEALLDWATAGDSPSASVAAGQRALLVADSLDVLLRAGVGCWARGASLVALAPELTDVEQSDPARWARIVDGERVTTRIVAESAARES